MRPFFPERILFWIVFTFGLSLLPLILAMVSIDGPSFQAEVDRGDLILAAVVISGVEVGNAYFLRPVAPLRRLAKAAIIAFGAVFALITSFMYANTLSVVAAAQPAHLPVVQSEVLRHSWVVLVGSIVLGVGNSYLQHVEEIASGRYESR